jgi:hypothetical protein
MAWIADNGYGALRSVCTSPGGFVVADEVTLSQPRAESEPPAVPDGPETPAVSDGPETPAVPPAPETGGRRRRWRRTLAVVGWVVVAAAVVAAVLAGVDMATGNHSGTSLRAKPGDCLSGESDSDLTLVPCDHPDVRWTVVGVVENKTRQEATENACAAWPNAEASYWESRNGTSGFVLCLGPLPTA